MAFGSWTRMDLLDFVIRMLGLALQVLGLLLTFTAVRSLAQLRLKVERAPGCDRILRGFIATSPYRPLWAP